MPAELSTVPAVLPPGSPAAPGRPLVVSADEELLDEVLRLLGSVGAEPELTLGGPTLRRAHRSAPLVLVGADVLPSGGVRVLPRRPGLLVLAREEPGPEEWSAAMELGAERVVVLPREESWLLARVASALRAPSERAWSIGVGGSCGGAGASTLAAALAMSAAAEHGRALLVDADPAGGGLDLVVGTEREEGARWPELLELRGQVAGEALLAALPELNGLHLLAASREQLSPVPEQALSAVVDAVRAAGWPVVVDLPRCGPAVDAVLPDADLAVLLVPGRLRAACAARLLLSSASPAGGPAWEGARVVLRGMPGGGLGSAEVGEILGRPVLDQLPHDPRALGRGERGQPPPVAGRTAWGRLTRRLVAEVVEGERGR